MNNINELCLFIQPDFILQDKNYHLDPIRRKALDLLVAQGLIESYRDYANMAIVYRPTAFGIQLIGDSNE